MTEHIRVVIADDHNIVRSGIRLLLSAEPDIEVVGEALDGVEAIELAGKLNPDVMIMDITMPGMDGLEATTRLRKLYPNMPILVLTMHRSDAYFFELIKAGASGYVLKGAKTNELIEAVRVVSKGEVFLHPSMAQKLVQGYLYRSDQGRDTGINLSPREVEILRLIAEGFSTKEIADTLVISQSTVHTHRGNLMIKLGLNNRHELIQYARDHGFIKQ